MTTITAVTRTRQDTIRELLDRILTSPAPTNYQDNLRAGTHDRAATTPQFDRVEILMLLHGRDEVAAAYHQWITDNARDHTRSTPTITAWIDLPLDTARLPGGLVDRHRFLCAVCAASSLQV